MRRKRWICAGILVLLVGRLAITYSYRHQLIVDFDPVYGPSKDTVVENIRAFAKLYGYVRYFHPSDAAAETDWNKFAIHGVRQVKDATSRMELRSDLETLFEPIGSTLQLYRMGREPPDLPDVLTPLDTAERNLVAWQHRGVGLGRGMFPYRSTRLHRAPFPAEADGEGEKMPFVQVLQSSISLGRGEEAKLRAAVRLDLRRQGRRDECHVHYGRYRFPPQREQIEQLRDDIYYVDLDRAPWSQVKNHLKELAKADGLIFDMRGYPEGHSPRIVQHLSRDTLRSHRYETLKIIYPDQDHLVGYDTLQTTYLPEDPQIEGPVMFVTNASAGSYPETLMGIVKHYKLGTIVGQPPQA